MKTKVTEKEIKSCFPSTIAVKKISFDYDSWEIRFRIDYYDFVLFINCTESTTVLDSVWYTAHLRIRENQNFEINYGFSNYYDTYDYILKAIYLDLESFEKTGKFSKYVKGYHNTFTPEKLEKHERNNLANCTR